jgi:hypothetical protein
VETIHKNILLISMVINLYLFQAPQHSLQHAKKEQKSQSIYESLVFGGVFKPFKKNIFLRLRETQMEDYLFYCLCPWG